MSAAPLSFLDSAIVAPLGATAPEPIGITSTVAAVAPVDVSNAGGGDLNGSSNQAHMRGGGVGTNGTKTQVPRTLKGSGNYTGIV